MTTTLNVQESGKVKYVRRPGAMLEAGCMVARLELDDPSKVRPVCETRHSYSVSRTGRWLLALKRHLPRWAQERACLCPHPPQHPTKSKTHVLPMIFRVPRGVCPAFFAGFTLCLPLPLNHTLWTLPPRGQLPLPRRTFPQMCTVLVLSFPVNSDAALFPAVHYIALSRLLDVKRPAILQ